MIAKQVFDFGGDTIYVMEHTDKEKCGASIVMAKEEILSIEKCKQCNEKIIPKFEAARKTTWHKYSAEYREEKKKTMNQKQRLVAMQLDKSIESNKRDLGIELELVKFLDEQGLCFTDLK